MNCIHSGLLADEYWIEGSRFTRKRCPCGKIFDLEDGKAFPDHEPQPLGRPRPKRKNSGRERSGREQRRP